MNEQKHKRLLRIGCLLLAGLFALSLLGSVAFWSFAVQGVSAQNFAMIRAGATRGRRWFLTILMVLFVPILPMFAGCVDQIRDPRGLRDDRHRKDDDFSDF